MAYMSFHVVGEDKGEGDGGQGSREGSRGPWDWATSDKHIHKWLWVMGESIIPFNA